MDQSIKVAKTLAVVLFLVVALVSGTLVFGLRAVQKRQQAELVKTRDEAVTKLKDMETLISERSIWEGKQAASTQELTRYNLVLEKGAPMPQDGFNYVYADEYEPTLYRDLQRLAEYTGCTFDFWKLGEYTRRPTETRPAPTEDGKLATVDPAKEEKYKRDEEYLGRLRSIEQVARISKVDLRIRGRMENIQLFVVGLSGFQVPTGRAGSPYWYFPELIVVSNLTMRSIEVDPELVAPGIDDPIIEATLECRYFPFKPMIQAAPLNGAAPTVVPAPTATAQLDTNRRTDPAMAAASARRSEQASGGERPMAQQSEAGGAKSTTTQYIILGALVVAFVVIGAWFFLSSRPKSAPRVALAEGAGAAAQAESEAVDANGLPARGLQPAEMQIVGESPFRPKDPGGLERPGVPRSAGNRVVDPGQRGPVDEAPPVEQPDPEETPEAQQPEGEPKRIAPAPERPSGAESVLPELPAPGDAMPPFTPPPVGDGDLVPAPEAIAPEPDRASQVFARFATPGMGGGDLERPTRGGEQPLQVTGTIVGADGGTMAILTDGTQPYYVRQGQQLSVQGKPTRVLSIDRGSVTLEHGPETVTLHSIGGAGQ
jgi:hypothetical protein